MSNIRIQNIYYMLSYAFQALNENGYSNIALEDFEDAADLLAAILAKGIEKQIKRGLGREYIPKTEALSALHGKINVSLSINQQTFLTRKMVCTYDEFTENAYVNRVLKTTAMLLIRCPEVKQERKQALKRVMLFFSRIDNLDPYSIQWSAIQYSRNNATYKMLVHLCSMVINHMLLTTQTGNKRINKYLDDQYMSSLYERFVREYFRKHYPDFNASASYIGWDVDNFDQLPIMRSDITLVYEGHTLIIDTKYYSHTMQYNSRFDSKSLISGNIYQIYTYVKNRDANHDGSVSGMLLYAKTEHEDAIAQTYNMSGNIIFIRTLDLNSDFQTICNQLNEIASLLLRLA